MSNWLVGMMLLSKLLALVGVVMASTRPDTVNVGAVLTSASIVGKVAEIAIEAAVEDVNSRSDVLKGTKLNVTVLDARSDGFLGIFQTLRFMESETVAIIGPQSSTVAHVVSPVAKELRVPLVSFSAIDPTLSSLQYPYFVRTSPNDLYQMAAIADIVQYYGWREVIAIFGDDDQGKNGVAALGDQLAERRCRISYKAALPPDPTRDDITELLVKVALSECRIIVLHAPVTWGPLVLSVAQYHGLMGSGYVWIATTWLSTILDTNSPLPLETMDDMQGVLTLRSHIPESPLKQDFVSRWKNLTAKSPIKLNTYGYIAYDTVWLLARALDEFFNQGSKISFSNDKKLRAIGGGNLHLETLSMFDEGELLLKRILEVDTVGLRGQIKFTPDRNLIHLDFDVLNVIGTGHRKVGYWSDHSGLTVVPPEMLYGKPSNRLRSKQKLYSVIWPGQTTEKPRGWVFPNNGRHLRIGVPNRYSFREFISVGSNDIITGYCVDVFSAAINLLPYAVPYKFVPFGDGRDNPSNTELVRLITAVGDITIVPARTRMADFTQPYIESGLVVVAPVRKQDTNAFAFLRPFTPTMWAVTAMSFLLVGAVVWILEHKVNDQFRGPPRRQLFTVFWFGFSTLFFAHREDTISTLGRILLIIWLFAVLIINSSYTASLTSILTVHQLSSPIKGIDSLAKSNTPIGYPHGSYARDYLVNDLKIHESRLVPLHSPEEYDKALKDGPDKGGVAAVVDERAYIELFLSNRCNFSIIGREFSKNGWGFAFPRDSQLAIDMSIAILKLSENGDLQRIHDKWLLRKACTLQGAELAVDRLELKSFSGLFVLCGLACLLALLIYFFRVVRQYHRHYAEELEESSRRSSASARIQTFLSFVDEKEEEVKSRSKRRQLERSSYISEDVSTNGSPNS